MEPSDRSGAMPFAEGASLLEACGDRRPCAAELWRSEQGDEAVAVQIEALLEWGGATWPTTWRRVGTELTYCLPGGPLALPPAGDPGGFRLLSATAPPQDDRDAMWLLHLSGENPCELSGELLLSATRDRADSRDLYSGGKPWAEGGREHALSILQELAAQAD